MSICVFSAGVHERIIEHHIDNQQRAVNMLTMVQRVATQGHFLITDVPAALPLPLMLPLR